MTRNAGAFPPGESAGMILLEGRFARYSRETR